MAINPNMVLDFAQNLGRQKPLTQLGKQLNQTVGIQRNKKAQEEYDELFKAYRENPNQETGLALTQASIPLGMGQETMAAIQMYGQQEPGGEVGTAGIPPYLADAHRAWSSDPTNTQLKNNLLAAEAQAVSQGFENLDGYSERFFKLYEQDGQTGEGETGRGPLPPYVQQAVETYLNEPNANNARLLTVAEGRAVNEGHEGLKGYASQIIGIESESVAGDEATAAPSTSIASLQPHFEELRAAREAGDTTAEENIRWGIRSAISELPTEDARKAGLESLQAFDALQEQQRARQLQQEYDESIDALAQNTEDDTLRKRAAFAAMRTEKVGDLETALEMVDTRADMRKQEMAEERFEEAREALEEDYSYDRVIATMEAAREAGVLDEAQVQIDAMEDEEKTQALSENSSILDPLVAGNINGAMREIDDRIRAARNDGDTDTLNDFLEMKGQIRDGEVDPVIGELSFDVAALGTDESEQYLREIQAFKNNRREERMVNANITRIVAQNPFRTEGEKNRVVNQMERMSGDLARETAELFIVRPDTVRPGSDTWLDYLDQEASLRREYDDDVADYREATDSAATIRGLIESDASNFSDRAITILYNKVLDPGSVVRQSEAKSTEEAQAAFDYLKTMLPRLKGEGSYAPEAKDQILSAINTVETVYREAEQNARSRIESTLDVLWSDNPEQREASNERIFQPLSGQEEFDAANSEGSVSASLQTLKDSDLWGGMTPEEKERAQNLTPAQLRYNFSSLFEATDTEGRRAEARSLD